MVSPRAPDALIGLNFARMEPSTPCTSKLGAVRSALPAQASPTTKDNDRDIASVWPINQPVQTHLYEPISTVPCLEPICSKPPQRPTTLV